MNVKKSVIDRLMARVELLPEAGCWIFTGFLNKKGYGQIGNGSRGTGLSLVHRITYSHFIGEIPKGLFVLHRCDVPSCCNPHHLFLGTNKDNCNDRDFKNRVRHGEKHPFSKLNYANIQEIRKLQQSGMFHSQIAKLFNVAPSHITNIVNFKSWKRAK